MKERHAYRVGVLRRVAAVVAAGSLVAMGSAFGQDAPQGVRPFVVYEHAPMSAWMVDEKDAGLRAALAMIPARLSELPGELPDMPPELEPMLQMVLRTLAQPARVAVVYNPENAIGGFFGYGMTVSVLARDEGHARELHRALDGAMQEMGDLPQKPAASMRFTGMMDIALPFGLVSYGPRQVAEGWRYEVVVGAVDVPDDGFGALPTWARPGLSPVARASVHLSALTPGVSMVRTLAGPNLPPEGAEVIAGLEKMGVIGEGAVRVEMVAGYTASAAVSETRVKGAAAFAEAWNVSSVALGAGDYAMVPSDAVMVSIGKGDLKFVTDAMDTMAARGAPIEDFLAGFQRETGVDLRRDVIESIGGTWGGYMSDSTGGGSLMSGVVFASLKDAERFKGAHAKLVARARQELGKQAEGKYVRLKSWNDGAAELVSVQFPGLPVPLEITYGVAGDWLVGALTPQGAMVAARQALGKGDRGLMANAAFAGAIPSGKELLSVSFVDSARTMRDGYGMVSMVGSAVGNLARSPVGDRDVGVLVPTFNELRAGVRPAIKYSHWDGDDLVMMGESDRSMLVNAAGSMGGVSAFMPLLIAAPIWQQTMNGRMSRWGLDDGSMGVLMELASRDPAWILDPARRQVTLMAIGAMEGCR